MEPAEDTDRVAFYQEISKPAAWLIVVLIGGFGLLFLAGGASHFPRMGGDDWVMLGMGAALLFLSWRLYLFLFRARMEITKESLMIRSFFGTRRYRFGDVVSIGRYSKKFRPRGPSGKSMHHTLTTAHLVLRLRSGKEVTHTLPHFGMNEQVINTLEQKTGQIVEQLPNVDKT